MPPPSPEFSTPSRRGLAPTRAVLRNGIVVLAKETRKTPAITVNLALRSGSVCDPNGAGGAMNLLAQTLDRGTATRSALTIGEELDRRGASLNIGVTRHLISIVCTCLAEDFAAMLALLADIVMTASFPQDEFVVRKREVETAIAQDDDNPYVRAGEELMIQLYGIGHPYGRPMKGSPESLHGIERSDLIELQRVRFAPSELIAVVVGDVAASKAVDLIGHTFEPWLTPAPLPLALPRPVRSTTRRRIVLPMMNKAQADVAYGFVSIARSDPHFYAHWLMNNVLGQYALGGRLGDSIRERQGMAYYVSSALEAQIVEGPLFIRAGVSPEHVDQAIRSIDEELDRMRLDGITERELTESRNYLIGSMPRSLETNAGIANFIQRGEVFGLGLDFDLQIANLLHAVTLADVKLAAGALDPSRATIVVAGPYRDA